MFRVALIGHSQVPTNYEYSLGDFDVRVYYYRRPGARIKDVSCQHTTATGSLNLSTIRNLDH